MKQYQTNNPAETKRVAKIILKNLQGGEILGLVGNLGTGKTVFVQGLAEALGIKEVVNSPSFVLMKVYGIRNKPACQLAAGMAGGGYGIRYLIHTDAYRLESFEQLREIGIEEYLNRDNCLVVVEWADRVPAIKQYSNYHEINFQEGKSDNERVLTFS